MGFDARARHGLDEHTMAGAMGEAVKNSFKPEFVNRIDEIVVFQKLTEADIARIVDIQVDSLRGRLAERDLGLELTSSAREHVARVGYDPDFGARPLKRVIQKELADPIALAVLQGDYADGDTIEVDSVADGGLVFTRRSFTAV
jgi:ATP-dependent Clp protease ATP-binding subunit ClpB